MKRMNISQIKRDIDTKDTREQQELATERFVAIGDRRRRSVCSPMALQDLHRVLARVCQFAEESVLSRV